jgi:hypothetical protein
MAEIDKKDQLGKKDQLALRKAVDNLAKAIAALQKKLNPVKRKRKKVRGK